MTYRAHVLSMGLFMAVLFVGVGCSTPPKKTPMFMDPAFNWKAVEPIHIVSIVDARKDVSKAMDMEDEFRKPVAKGITQYGYAVMPNASAGPAMDRRQMVEMTPEELAALGPSDARAVLVVFVDDVSEKYVVMGYTYKLEMSAMLIDKQTRKLLWKDKGIGSAGQGGLISGAMAPLCKAEAKDGCLRSLFASFPEKVQEKEQKK